MTDTPITIPDTAKRPWKPADASWFRGIQAAVAVAAAAGCVAAAAFHPRQFFFRYLAAAVFLASVGAGSLFWLLLHYLTGASWSTVMRRLIEHATALLLPAALLFVPLIFGLENIFSWASEGRDGLTAAKQAYLNGPFFIVRSAGYFSIWIALALAFRRRSLRQDSDTRQPGLESPNKLCAPGMIMLALTATFAAFDWIMSLDPHWYSNIFGVYFWAGSISGSLALITLFALWARRRSGLERLITVEHCHDLGKLQLGFVSFWAYIAFSQYLLIWYANIPEETVWYVQRSQNGWGTASIVLAFGRFILPFLILLPRGAKRSPLVLACLSVWLLAFHAFDLYWQILPTLGAEAYFVHWIDPLVWTLVLSVGLWTLATAASDHPLAPVGDPRLSRAMAFENE